MRKLLLYFLVITNAATYTYAASPGDQKHRRSQQNDDQNSEQTNNENVDSENSGVTGSISERQIMRDRSGNNDDERNRGGNNRGNDRQPPPRNEPPRRPEPVRPEPPRRPEPVRPEPPRRPEPVRPEPPRRPEPVRPEPPRRPEPVRPEPPRRPEPVRPEPPRRPEPVRPEPGRPLPPHREPVRPGPERPFPDRGFPRRGDEDARRDEYRRERDRHSEERRRYEDERWYERDRFERDRIPRYREDLSRIRDEHRWYRRYDDWYYRIVRPAPIYYILPPYAWYRPMPDYDYDRGYYDGYWNYYQVSIVADNLERLTMEIYNIMEPASQTTPNREYAERLLNVLWQLYYAANVYNDVVDQTTYWSDSIYELFYLDESLTLAERTLSGYSQAYRVQNEMAYMRYYVNQLLWMYRQQM